MSRNAPRISENGTSRPLSLEKDGLKVLLDHPDSVKAHNGKNYADYVEYRRLGLNRSARAKLMGTTWVTQDRYDKRHDFEKKSKWKPKTDTAK